ALAVRVPVLAARVSRVGLASHVSTAIRARMARGSWLCQREEPTWLAPAYKWTLVLDALKSADRKNPGAGPHPRSPEWERTYGQAITGDTCARQAGTVQRWLWESASQATCVVHSGIHRSASGCQQHGAYWAVTRRVIHRERLWTTSGQVVGSSSGSRPEAAADRDRQPQRPETQNQTSAT